MSKAKPEERPVPKPEIVVADVPESVQTAAFELAAKIWKGPEVFFNYRSLCPTLYAEKRDDIVRITKERVG